MNVQTSPPDTPSRACNFAERLLEWYDGKARTLPWRAAPGTLVLPDPYRVWLSEVMLQQTTVAAVARYYQDFIARWPTVEALAAADDSDVMAAWAGLGYYARARNLLACARAVVASHGGRFPDNEAGLRSLPGIGEYSSAAIAAFAFGRKAVVIDANIERVIARHRGITTPLPATKKQIRAALSPDVPAERSGDFAQAMMDIGATICTARAPHCTLCPVIEDCSGRRSGNAERLPVKPAKKAKPHRYGVAHWIERDDAIWLVQRPTKGMLGGMRALPGGDWRDARVGESGIAEIDHSFTHFDLTLTLVRRESPDSAAEGEWWPLSKLDAAGLPTLYRKLVDKMRERNA